MEEAGVIKSAKIGEADVKLMKANEVYEFTAREMKRDPFLLYYIKKEGFLARARTVCPFQLKTLDSKPDFIEIFSRMNASSLRDSVWFFDVIISEIRGKNFMKPYTSLKSILAEFFPLHRTLASDDHDKTLEIVGSYMPDSSNYTIETYAPLTPVWTWKVPERYVVHEAYLETEDGERIVDFKDNPLHIVSYSLPIDKV
jgi:hypothetical protein